MMARRRIHPIVHESPAPVGSFQPPTRTDDRRVRSTSNPISMHVILPTEPEGNRKDLVNSTTLFLPTCEWMDIGVWGWSS